MYCMPYFIDGINGVFDTEELVKLLKLENCIDICVIDIPSNINVSNQVNSVRVRIFSMSLIFLPEIDNN